MLSSFPVNYTIIALPIFPRHKTTTGSQKLQCRNISDHFLLILSKMNNIPLIRENGCKNGSQCRRLLPLSAGLGTKNVKCEDRPGL
jgi:hypothetical protein